MSLADLRGRIPRWSWHREGQDFTLPNNWDDQVQAVADDHARRIFSDTPASTSVVELVDGPLDFRAVDGLVIRQHLPWLDDWYRSSLIRLVDPHLSPADDVRSGANINLFDSPLSRFRWHIDSNSVTALLFVNSLKEEDGGHLRFLLRDEPVLIQPQRGLLLVYDARGIPHTVDGLTSSARRYSVAFNLYEGGEEHQRPPDIDPILYS